MTRNGNARAAEATLEDAMIGRFGSLARLAKLLVLRSDNGLVIKSKRFTMTVRRYGVEQVLIQPHAPHQNWMIERLFRTMKEQCIWLHRFESLDEDTFRDIKICNLTEQNSVSHYSAKLHSE